MRRAHLRWYVGFVEQTVPRIDRGDGGPQHSSASSTRGRRDANLRAALEFARQDGDTIAALQIAGPLGRYAYLRGHYHEVREWMDAAVTAAARTPPPRCGPKRCWAAAGWRCCSATTCPRSAGWRQPSGCTGSWAIAGHRSALQVLGSVAREQGRYARAMELHAESLATPRPPVTGGRSRARMGIPGLRRVAAAGLRAGHRGVHDGAGHVPRTRSCGGDRIVAAQPWRHRPLPGRPRAGGRAAGGEPLPVGSIGFREGIAWSLEQLGLLAADRGDPGAARCSAAALRSIASCATGGVPAACSKIWRRWRWQTASLRRRPRCWPRRGVGAIGTVIAPCERAQHAETVAGARAALGDDTFTAAWQQGLLAPLDDLQAELPTADTAAAAARRGGGQGGRGRRPGCGGPGGRHLGAAAEGRPAGTAPPGVPAG